MTDLKNNSAHFYADNYPFLQNSFNEFIKKEETDESLWQELSDKNQVATIDIDFLAHNLVGFYRKNAARHANLNPLNDNEGILLLTNFAPSNFNIEDRDLNKKVTDEKSHFYGKTINEIIIILNKQYLNGMSAEFEHIHDKEKYEWLAQNYEQIHELTSVEQTNIIDNIMEAENFEHFLHVKFPGAKRFSIEGTEAAIVIFESFLQTSVELEAQEVVIGMAHRGRLNFLTKVCGEKYSYIFGQFAGKNAFDASLPISGDVKYHLGASSDRIVNNKKVHLALMPNPSHLEAVNSVVMGAVRCKQDAVNDLQRNKILPFLIHGDASFVGQGVVYEGIAMDGLAGYDIGGVVHLIIDNQIGFTATSSETRSSLYASDVAKNFNIPIFHVNADHAEAAFIIGKIVAKYRAKFKGDIIINLVGYRRYGHNEGDEPNFTQPLMYQKIANHPTLYNIYKKYLIEKTLNTEEALEQKKKNFHAILEAEFNEFKPKKVEDLMVGHWQNIPISFDDQKIDSIPTATIKEVFTQLRDCLVNIPSTIEVNPKIKKLVIDARIKMLGDSQENIDWGCAEMLAFGSILNEGHNIRISGEDVVRGTFAHRHCAVIDQKTDQKYFYYQAMATDNAKFEAYNSLLSEYAVMGFDYGYSSVTPKNLVIWEAQFGDFANGAQIMIDQYLAGAEQKWLRMSNLILMLPHGYEGQGPEHSSGRIERFLQLAAQYNIRIVQPTTPANLFHVIRRQMLDPVKKPLIIFTPKSLLRHKLVISKHEEFLNNSCFRPILYDKTKLNIKKIILCSGKIYYDLYDKAILDKRDDILLVRLEQIYPLPLQEIISIIEQYKLPEIFWCQDESQNMGSFNFIMCNLYNLLNIKNIKLNYIGRPASASVSVGSNYEHIKEQKKIIEECFI